MRRSYLIIHLKLSHGFLSATARRAALNAKRGDTFDQNSYYEDISNDECVRYSPGNGRLW